MKGSTWDLKNYESGSSPPNRGGAYWGLTTCPVPFCMTLVVATFPRQRVVPPPVVWTHDLRQRVSALLLSDLNCAKMLPADLWAYVFAFLEFQCVLLVRQVHSQFACGVTQLLASRMDFNIKLLAQDLDKQGWHLLGVSKHLGLPKISLDLGGSGLDHRLMQLVPNILYDPSPVVQLNLVNNRIGNQGAKV